MIIDVCVLRRLGYREAVAASLVLLQVILIVAAFAAGGFREEIDPEISLEVVKTRKEWGELQGRIPVEGKVWQVVQVNFVNLNQDAMLEPLPWDFYAYTEDNERTWPFNSDRGPFDPIEPGGNSTLMLIFGIEEGSHLVELEYIKKASGPVTCTIPGLISGTR